MLIQHQCVHNAQCHTTIILFHFVSQICMYCCAPAFAAKAILSYLVLSRYILDKVAIPLWLMPFY